MFSKISFSKFNFQLTNDEFCVVQLINLIVVLTNELVKFHHFLIVLINDECAFVTNIHSCFDQDVFIFLHLVLHLIHILNVIRDSRVLEDIIKDLDEDDWYSTSILCLQFIREFWFDDLTDCLFFETTFW